MERSQGREEEDGTTGCCMCGDVGFSDQLRRCRACRTRSQHTYCSQMYPNIEMDKWQCEWCIHNDYKHQQHKQQQQSKITTTRLRKRPHRDEGETVEGRDLIVGQNTTVSTAKKQHLQQLIKESSPSMVMAPPRTTWDRDSDRDRWRKPRCNSLSPRRYKLLADVLC